MANSFNAGDVIVLKSGGPKMTVTSAGDTGDGVPHVWTAWFEKDNNKSGCFPAASVELWKESEASGRIKRGG